MATWKYQKPKKVSTYDNYIHLRPSAPTQLTITDWSFTKNPHTDSLFTALVKEEDGKPVDKIWSVWDFDAKQELKKLLRGLNPNHDSVKLKVTRHVEYEEDSFTVVKLD